MIVIFPDVALTLSLNVRTMLALTAIPVALSAGVEDERVGAIIDQMQIISQTQRFLTHS